MMLGKAVLDELPPNLYHYGPIIFFNASNVISVHKESLDLGL